ncbi:hypothetical protein P872_19555 [Rhodonellum psychrophilum GCM71 = DSM 17998]|uniref:Uncharacterized protein n=1 Tax=Rhodonellum psychrophilum GCM71 = DSM 17998 TaxID=1123057 RepID=U5BMG5_9BACT|nr:hypothetical protein P872_19555 [Rhodonellum psychrophilum GCM71 = DSM 17998]
MAIEFQDLDGDCVSFNPKYEIGFQIGLKLQENQTFGRKIPDSNKVKSKIVNN